MNVHAGTTRKSTRAARAEASVWVVRLHSQARTPEMEAGLRNWLAARPENAREFEHITDVWDLGGAVTADGLPRLRFWSSTPYRRWSLAAAAACACALGLLFVYQRWIDPPFTTGHGEQRLLRLDDGSRISMNSDTQVRIELTSDERRVRLERGEGFFEVAKDSKRPFIVTAGDRQVTALGTAFVVRYEPAGTAITLVEGKIAVSAPSSFLPLRDGEVSRARGSSTVLSPGERLILGASAPPKLDTPRLEAVTAWRRGEVLLDNTPLSEAVAEMNRYDKRQLIVDGEDLAGIRISGVYRTGDSLGFARAAAELHRLTIVENLDRIHLQRSVTSAR